MENKKRLLFRAAQNEIILFINIKILQNEELEEGQKKHIKSSQK
ncbi:hypothetical protein [Enterococcus faecium]|nr:hypothetical protein [Enterococcus faecium]